MAFSPDGKTLASASDDDTVRLWDLGEILAGANPSASSTILTGHWSWVHSVAFSLDGETLASTSEDKTIRLWDLRPILAGVDPSASSTILTGHWAGGSSNHVAFLPDGERLASGSSGDGTIRLWPTSQGLYTIACSHVSRNLTWEEWQEFLSAFPYEKTCSHLPVHCSVPVSAWPAEHISERAMCES